MMKATNKDKFLKTDSAVVKENLIKFKAILTYYIAYL